MVITAQCHIICTILGIGIRYFDISNYSWREGTVGCREFLHFSLFLTGSEKKVLGVTDFLQIFYFTIRRFKLKSFCPKCNVGTVPLPYF